MYLYGSLSDIRGKNYSIIASPTLSTVAATQKTLNIHLWNALIQASCLSFPDGESFCLKLSLKDKNDFSLKQPAQGFGSSVL